MVWKAVTSETIRLAIRLAILLVSYTLLRDTGLYELMARETEGLNTLILLVGSIYAVILAFAIFVIWGQFTEVEDRVMRECSSLADLLRFSDYVPADLSREIRKAVENYAQWVLKHEWQALADGRREKRAEELFSELVTTVIAWEQADQADQADKANAFHVRLIDIVHQAGERRTERVTTSLTRIPPTMFWFVNLIAIVLLLLVFIYPFHHAVVGAGCLLLIAIILSMANFVMRDMDNPLDGAWNVSSKPFAELK